MIVMKRGTLQTIGYTQPEANARIDTFLAQPRAFLVDIRLKPYSRFRPTWNRSALQSRYGRRYVHLRGLGNVHSQDRTQPIHLLDPEPHVQHLAEQLNEGCHRKTVYEQVLLALGEHSSGTVGTVSALSLWAE